MLIFRMDQTNRVQEPFPQFLLNQRRNRIKETLREKMELIEITQLKM